MAKIFIDAYADCDLKEAAEAGLELAPSKIKIGKKVYNIADKIGFSQEQILTKIKKGECSVIPLTIKEWADFFRPYLDNGDDIIMFSISQNLMADGGEDLCGLPAAEAGEFPAPALQGGLGPGGADLVGG